MKRTMATLLLKTLAKETHKRPLFNKLSTPWDLKAFFWEFQEGLDFKAAVI